MSYLILKSLHTVFIIAWMAALLYVARLFVYWVETETASSKQLLATMAKRLQLGIGWPAAIVSTVIGLHMAGVSGAFAQGWFHYKLLMVVLLFGYQHACWRIGKKCMVGIFNKSAGWCRVFNEVPTLLMTGVVFVVITKQVFAAVVAQIVLAIVMGVFFILKQR